MPFNNAGKTTITTYNDIAGNQYINIYSTAPSSALLLPQVNTAPSPSIEFPTKEPFSTLTRLLYDAHQAFSPIPLTLSNSYFLREMDVSLRDLLTSTVLAGALIEAMERVRSSDDGKSRRFLGSSFTLDYQWTQDVCVRIMRTVDQWPKEIQGFVDEVRRYRGGLELTLVGPVWRRILWSIMFSLSEDMDIVKIVGKTKHDVDSLSLFMRNFLVCIMNIHSKHLSEVAPSLVNETQLYITSVPDPIPVSTATIHTPTRQLVIPMVFIESYTLWQPFFCDFVNLHDLSFSTPKARLKLLKSNRSASYECYKLERVVSSNIMEKCLVCFNGIPLETGTNGWQSCTTCGEAIFHDPVIHMNDLSEIHMELEVQRSYFNITQSGTRPSVPGRRKRTYYHPDNVSKCKSLRGVEGDAVTLGHVFKYLSASGSSIQSLHVAFHSSPNIFLEPTAPDHRPIVLQHLHTLGVTLNPSNLTPSFEWTASFPILRTLSLKSSSNRDLCRLWSLPSWIADYTTIRVLKISSAWINPSELFASLVNLRQIFAFYSSDRVLQEKDMADFLQSLEFAKDNSGHPIEKFEFNLLAMNSPAWVGSAAEWGRRISVRWCMECTITVNREKI